MRRSGYGIYRVDRTPSAQFAAAAVPIYARREAQTRADADALRERYREPVFGEVRVFAMVELLAHVIDPIDRFLLNVSQEVHTLQVVEGLVAEGADDDVVLAGVLHDVGKVLLLVGEDPANVVGTTEPIGEHPPGIGLDQCAFQYSADEFAYSRLHAYLPDHVGWMIRYHGIVAAACTNVMDARDRTYYEQYGRQLQRLDHATKSLVQPPSTRITDYRDLVDAAFPDPIPF